MTHRDITLTDEERTAALLVYLFTCLGFVCSTAAEHEPWFYGWATSRRGALNDRSFGAAVMWAMRYEDDRDDLSAQDPASWLSYVEHVVGYRCDDGNGHGRTRSPGGETP